MEDTQEVPRTVKISERLRFSPGYLLTPPGLIRVFNIILGATSLGLWIPGYENQFYAENYYNPVRMDSTSGYGAGYKEEFLNQFVLAAILICLGISIILICGMIAAVPAMSSWSRLNKVSHLILGVFLMSAAICSVFGIWHFQENCCHVEMEWKLTRIDYRTGSFGGYDKYCYCYLTRHMNGFNLRQSMGQMIDPILYEPIRNPVDMSQFNENWEWAAHHIHMHIVAVFIIFLNSVLYIAAFFVSKIRLPTPIPAVSNLDVD